MSRALTDCRFAQVFEPCEALSVRSENRPAGNIDISVITNPAPMLAGCLPRTQPVYPQLKREQSLVRQGEPKRAAGWSRRNARYWTPRLWWLRWRARLGPPCHDTRAQTDIHGEAQHRCRGSQDRHPDIPGCRY